MNRSTPVTHYRLIDAVTGEVLAGPSRSYGYVEDAATQLEDDTLALPQPWPRARELVIQRSDDGATWKEGAL